MLLRIILCFVLFVSVAACSTARQAQETMNSKWVGKKSSEFFKVYGLPAGQAKIGENETIYQWGEVSQYSVPATANTYGSTSGGTYSSTTTLTGGGTNTMECHFQVIVDGNETIKEVSIIKDSVGFWEFSRCNEILN